FIMAENTLVEPSIQHLEEVGLELTHGQRVALFNYTQRGVQELESFREEPEENECANNKQTVQTKTKGNKRAN
ncbi:esterase, partial [Clostridium tepidum]